MCTSLKVCRVTKGAGSSKFVSREYTALKCTEINSVNDSTTHFKLLLNSFSRIEPITIFSQFTQTSSCSASMNFIDTNTNDFDAKV